MRFTYGIGLPDWEANFARASAAYCGKFSDREDFDAVTARYRAAFAAYRNGAFLKDFQPVFTPKREGRVFTGLIGSGPLRQRTGSAGRRRPQASIAAIKGLLRPARRTRAGT
ncbi:MAG: hypothetical protein QM713_00050 [Arachnia sp.]